MNFTDDDVKKAKELGQWFGKAKLDLPLAEYPKITNLLVWYSKLPEKIESNVFELKKVVETPPAPKKRNSRPKDGKKA